MEKRKWIEIGALILIMLVFGSFCIHTGKQVLEYAINIKEQMNNQYEYIMPEKSIPLGSPEP